VKSLIAGIVVAGACAVASADEGEILEIELRLVGGLRAADAPADAPENPSLLVDLTRTGDRWQRVWAVSSHSRKMQFLTGCVTTADVSKQRVVLDILLGGRTIRRVHVDLKHEAGTELNGTYRVASQSGTIEGTADGRIKPPRPPLPPGFEPVKPGERPRILFRRSQVPVLKEKSATPLGRVLFEKMGDEKAGDSIGAGVKYQLTGRREFADQARALATLQMAGQAGRYSHRTAWGRRPKQLAVAYDLCYDAWPSRWDY